ncbi:DUF2249 domain-containing protein [Halorussus rarus]|uniref:DUF2249 domain-containing protein n=1 Tax=Halorussus rarus TaxID=660515 RepID=UPI000E21971F|nr:DUF2249 domain-containing protein [Halorussus sp. JP-T4]
MTARDYTHDDAATDDTHNDTATDDTHNDTATDDTDRTARELDAREIDGEPFGAIMSALDDLGTDETLVLYNGFEPEPLYGVLDRRGFDHEAERVAPDEWRVEIAPR